MDIVERLRRTELHHVWDDLEGKMVGKMFSANPDGPEAADEIERLREEISELKYKEAYASRAYMAARRMLDERGIHMDYFLSRANYESEVKDKNNGWIPQ